MADVDTALEQQILDLSQRQWVADIHHHREADDFGRTVEVAEGISHLAKLWMPHLRINPFLSDNARLRHGDADHAVGSDRSCRKCTIELA